MSDGAPAARDGDVIIVGAGPVGIALALSLSQLGLQVILLEQQAESALAEAADDGREIALHHRSRRQLEALGALDGLGEQDISPIRSARVYNGRSPRFLDFASDRGGTPDIGYLIANWRIRRGLYRRLKQASNVELLCEHRLLGLTVDQDGVQLETRGNLIRGRLLVAADSRHSYTRQALGIPARLHDFGKSMLVCRVEHSDDHGGIACEWFDTQRTIATLPLHGRQSSLAITLSHAEAEALVQMDAARFSRTVTRWLHPRLGELRLSSQRFRYPLIATYAQRFAQARAALIGDAAVGMHPVTAHGFNFGLHSQDLLSRALACALRHNEDYASESVLRRYERGHRRHTLPLYLATNAIVDLYTRQEPGAQIVRRLGIALSSHLPPFKHAVLAQLMRDGGAAPAKRPSLGY